MPPGAAADGCRLGACLARLQRDKQHNREYARCKCRKHPTPSTVGERRIVVGFQLGHQTYDLIGRLARKPSADTLGLTHVHTAFAAARSSWYETFVPAHSNGSSIKSVGFLPGGHFQWQPPIAP